MRMKRLFNRRRTLSLLVFFLAGCVTINIFYPVRDILFSDEETPHGFGAYGYLIFTKRFKELDRGIAVCDAFYRNLEPVSRNLPIDDRVNVFPTFWLSSVNLDDFGGRGHYMAPYYDKVPECRHMIWEYDYARAKIIASAAKVLSSQGPILVAWSQPFEKVNNDETALILDLSDFSDKDLDRAFGIWMDRITRDPAVWRDGLNIVLVKEAFRNFLEKYGDEIIKSIKTVKEIIS